VQHRWDFFVLFTIVLIKTIEMKTNLIIAFFSLMFCTTGFSQAKLPVEFRVEKQSMCTPMGLLEDVIFTNYYISKPVKVKFDGSFLNICFDNGAAFVKKNVTEVKRNAEYENHNLAFETILYTDKANASDTISLVIDHSIGFVQLIVPVKNSKGENIGYTSYKKFEKEDQLASQ
jgi:hypothetical protein